MSFKYIIDGKVITAEPSDTILTSALRAGIHIPSLCYDKRTEIYGACGLCVVEAEKVRGVGGGREENEAGDGGHDDGVDAVVVEDVGRGITAERRGDERFGGCGFQFWNGAGNAAGSLIP